MIFLTPTPLQPPGMPPPPNFNDTVINVPAERAVLCDSFGPFSTWNILQTAQSSHATPPPHPDCSARCVLSVGVCWTLVGAVAAVETKTSIARSLLSVGAAVLRVSGSAGPVGDDTRTPGTPTPREFS